MPDRRWIDFITQEVNETWDEANPGQPKTMGYVGSEEFIRLQFEEYLLSLISSVKYHDHLSRHGGNPKMVLPHIDGDPSHDFGPDWVEAWTRTENYRIWAATTESNLFDIVEPKHPCAGGLTVDDVQRRIAQQVQDLHLDERFAQGREVLGRNFAAGKEKANTMFNKLYADMEALREAQRKRAEEAKQQQQREGNGGAPDGGDKGSGGGGVDLAKAQQTMQSVGVRAGAYMNSWAAWAGEKRKAAGWGRSSSGTSGNGSSGGGGGGAGWSTGWGRSNKTRTSYASMSEAGASEKDQSRSPFTPSTPRFSSTDDGSRRPLTQDSFGESLLDGAGSESPASSHPASPERVRPPTATTAPTISTATTTTVAATEITASPVESQPDPVVQNGGAVPGAVSGGVVVLRDSGAVRGDGESTPGL